MPIKVGNNNIITLRFSCVDDERKTNLILAVYLIFLIAGVPIWLYCVHDGSSTIPTEFLEGRLDNVESEVKMFKKSEIKLKFTFLTPEAQPNFTWHNDKFDKFLNQLKPEMSFKLTFSWKYFDHKNCEIDDLVEWLMKNFRFRDERGREDIFNFIVIVEKEAKSEKDEIILIPNWGVVNVIKSDLKDSYSIDNFLVGFSKLIGYEAKDIVTWKRELNKFYLKRSFEMISQLKNSKDQIRIPSEVYKTRLLKLKEQEFNAREAFDLIDSVFHDPKLMAAAYFPNEHKFAVYLPVYLPLILPVLMALIKELKKRRRHKKEKERDNNNNNNNIKTKSE